MQGLIVQHDAVQTQKWQQGSAGCVMNVSAMVRQLHGPY